MRCAGRESNDPKPLNARNVHTRVTPTRDDRVVLAVDKLLGLAADWWEAIGVWLSLLPISVYGFVQLRDAKRLRHEQSRPFVIADLHNRSILAILAIVNVGPTVARNLRVHLPDGMQSAARTDMEWLGSAAFVDGVKMLAPGQELRFWFDKFSDRQQAGLPMRIPVTLEYEGPDGESYGPEEYVLDLLAHGPALLPDKTMHDLVGEVAGIRTEMAKWTNRSNGLTIFGHNADRAHAREWRPMHVSKAKEIRDDGGLVAAARYLIRAWRKIVGLHQWG